MSQIAETTRRPEATGRNPRSAPSRFKLVRVERVDGPDGTRGQWYRYLLENGRSTITGQRKGSLRDVTAHAERYADQLNARGVNGHSVWAPRGRKQA